MLFSSCNLPAFAQRLAVLTYILLVLGTLPVTAQSGTSRSWATPDSTAHDSQSKPSGEQEEAGVFFKAHFDASTKFSALKPGAIIEGVLPDAIYSGARELFPAGSRVRLTVESTERQRKSPNDHWPWEVKAFSPGHEKEPVFPSAGVYLPNGQEVSLRVSLLSPSDRRDVTVEWRAEKPATSKGSSHASAPAPQVTPSARATGRSARRTGTTATFEAALLTGGASGQAEPRSVAPASLPDRAIIDAGTQAKVVLLGAVSASKSHAGDVIAARLVEPVRIGEKVVLPEGTVFEGRVVKAMRPRWLSRPGSLLLTFDRLTLPHGVSTPLSASIIGAELDSRSHTTIDPEGNLNGGKPGKAWMLINLGATMGIAKAIDDGTQLVIELIVSTATDASTAGVGRIVAACISGIFMITRHGRDVILPKYTEMRIVLDGSVTLTPASPASNFPSSFFPTLLNVAMSK